ncbi:MAG TPA: hypothetical protein VE287_06880 [Actinopolymorphaceae bacterium]|nr:hypothetical protein [Actinopolymorphaceae bacterium]
MKWLLIFGGIALFAVVLYALLGVWLWRRAKALLLELDEAARKLDNAFPEEQEGRDAVPSGRSGPHRIRAGAGQRP